MGFESKFTINLCLKPGREKMKWNEMRYLHGSISLRLCRSAVMQTLPFEMGCAAFWKRHTALPRWLNTAAALWQKFGGHKIFDSFKI